MAEQAKRKVVSFETLQEVSRGNTDEKFDEVETPEWGGEGSYFRIGSLTANQMIEFTEANEGLAKRKAGLNLLVRSWVDDDGHRLGVDQLGNIRDEVFKMFENRNQAVCARVVRAVLKLNGLRTKAELDEAKNDSSEATPNASPTVLH